MELNIKVLREILPRFFLLEQVVAIKAYFMNKIHGLKNGICCLKNQLEDEEKIQIVFPW